MPLKPFDSQLPDPPAGAPLWRFMPLHFFQDFMANEELYLRRCDLYTKDDPQDGIPTDDFVRKQLGLEKYCIEDELALNSHQGSNRLFTEMYYLSCWNLYHKEHELQMWERYAKTGVAVQTTFGQLQAAVHQFLDDSHMGVVRYGDQDMTATTCSSSCLPRARSSVGRMRSALPFALLIRRAAKQGTTIRTT